MTKKVTETSAPPAAPKFRARVGFNYPAGAGSSQEIRVEAGDQDFELPERVAASLLRENAIEPFPLPAPPPAGSLAVVPEAGNVSLAQNGELSEEKE